MRIAFKSLLLDACVLVDDPDYGWNDITIVGWHFRWRKLERGFFVKFSRHEGYVKIMRQHNGKQFGFFVQSPIRRIRY